MSFTKLIGMISENEEAVALVKSLQETQEALTSQFNALEVKNSDIISSRDKVKIQLKKVKEKFGLDEITDDSLGSVLKTEPDEKALVEIANLKTQLEASVQSSKDIEDSYKLKIGNYVLKGELSNTGLAQEALNAKAYSILENLALDGASYTDDGNIVFKNPDGSTLYVDSKPITLSDKVNLLKADSDYAGLFKPQGNSGGGAAQNQGTGGKKFADYTEKERIQLFKSNPDEFKRLRDS